MRAKKHLNAWVDGELPDALREEVERHVAACARCREEVAHLRQIQSSLASMASVSLPPSLTAESVLQRYRRECAETPAAAEKWQVLRFLFPGQGAWKPALAMGSLACLLAVLWLYPSFHRWWVPTSVEIEIAQEMELFENLDLIRNLALLELLEQEQEQEQEQGEGAG